MDTILIIKVMRKTEYSIGSLLVVIIAILCILLLKQCNDTKVYKGRYQTISALNDSIKAVKIKKDTLYQKEVITLPPKEVLKMVVKDTSTKKFLFELSKQKDLVAAMRIALQGKDSIITELSKDTSEGGYWDWDFSGTSGNLAFEGNIKNNSDTNLLKLDYLYTLEVQTTIKEEKDKYIATYKINDNKVTLIGADNIIIPKKQTKKQKISTILIPMLTFGIGASFGILINNK